MSDLSLNLFTQADDLELAQYRILGGLQQARQAFGRSEVYPHLARLIRLRQSLQEIRAELERLRGPGRLTGIDLEEGELVYDRPDADPAFILDPLSAWALPLLLEAIEEGRAIYEFVDERTAVRALGIVPSYQDEGYLLVPDLARGGFRALRYAMSIFTGDETRYRSLRTSLIEDLPLSLLGATPEAVKRALIDTHPDLPNPATYLLETELDFPIEETMVPVAKRKLMQYLAMGGIHGAA
jgi:hypothetical protein